MPGEPADHCSRPLSAADKKRICLLKQGQTMKDHPCKAITSGAISEFVHYSEDRFLTIRECARIQTFPDSFKFSGTTSERILQIGNAVPPLLAEAIANSLHADLVSKLSNANTPGRLLSFVPTVSDGCSPVLEQVIARVQELVTCLNPS